MIRKRVFVFFLSCLFLSCILFGNNHELIKQLCEKGKEMDQKLRNYVKIINSSIYTYDRKGELLKTEKKHYEIIWNGKKWVDKNNEKDKTKSKDLEPFESGYQIFFNYSIQEKNDEYVIVVTLKEKFKKAHAEIGTYIVSKKTGYFKEEDTFFNRVPYSMFIKKFEMKTIYGEVEDGIIAPVRMENLVESKVFFGVGRKVTIITEYSYKKRKDKYEKL